MSFIQSFPLFVEDPLHWVSYGLGALFRMIRRIRGNTRGQASLLIAMMMLTFLLFFSFVIHTGMLVNAKINLQNAADLAAYAGAATQARQMNHIALLNYEMRRQYKKFLFRYYVIGQKGYYGSLGQRSQQFQKWRVNTGGQNLGVPTICIHFTAGENFCQAPPLPSVLSGATFNTADPIANALRQQIQALDQLRRQSGDKVDDVQAMTIMLWLYNTDPELRDLANSLASISNANAKKSAEELITISKGLGLVPRMYLLERRARTVAELLNFPGKTGMTLADANRWASDSFSAQYERSILAYRSAYRTLGEHSFDEDSIKLDELLPTTVFDLQTKRENFDVFYFRFLKKLTNGDLAHPNLHTNEFMFVPYPERVTALGVPMGVYKERQSLTYYAVRLRAKATLYFANPFGSEIELSAYAAARPFGSRLGPWDASQYGFFSTPIGTSTGMVPYSPTGNNFFEGPKDGLTPFVPQGCTSIGSGGGTGGPTIQNCANQIPNLPIAQDSLTNGGEEGFLSLDQAMRPLANNLASLQNGGGGVTQEGIKKAETAGMAPNPFEVGLYAMPFDSGTGDEKPDAFIRDFAGDGSLAIYAPLFPPGQENVQVLYNAIVQDFANNTKMDPSVVQIIATEIVNYVNKLKTSPGEDQESYNIARIKDPWRYEPGGPFIAVAPLHISAPTALKTKTGWSTSWNIKDQGPRAGYSVKFVTFSSLMNGLTHPNGSDDSPTNVSELSSLLGEDADALREPASH